jgi:hypothetical protein
MHPFTANAVLFSIIGFYIAVVSFMCSVLCSKPRGTLGEISDTLAHFCTPAENHRSTHLLLLTPDSAK